MLKNKTKEKLKSGKAVTGCVIQYAAPHFVELIGALGFDFVYIDAEHGDIDISQLENMVRAAELYELTPIARLPANVDYEILRFLDRGVMGILVPNIKNKKDAEAAVTAIKHYPLGERGAYHTGRISKFGTLGLSVDEYYRKLNEQSLFLAQIESINAVNNLQEILEVPGIDIINVGPSDLAQSMGLPGANRLDETIEKIVRSTLMAGKIAGVGGAKIKNMDKVLKYRAMGCQYFMFTLDDLIQHGAKNVLSKI